MKHLINLSAFLVLILISASCKDKNETLKPTEKDKILVNYPWRMSVVTDLNGKAIAMEKLNLLTQGIPSMKIEFVTGNKVYARGIADPQVINGGTWYLIEDSKVLDIDIISFKGKFGVEELSNSKMRLKSTMPVSGVDQETIMVFEPVVK
jgi:hypothetical protein